MTLKSKPVSDPAKYTQLWWMPSVEVLVFILVFVLTIYVMPILINSDGDLGRHITIGEVILDNSNIPIEDIFSHTMAGERLIIHEWLSDVIFAVVYRAYGLNGVSWLTAVLIAGSYAMLTAGLKYLGVSTFLRLAAGLIAASVGAIHWHTRPHIFTLLFFTFFLLALAYYYKTQSWRVLIPLPFLMIIWANLHGAFISGLVLVAIFGFGSLIEKKYSSGVIFFGLFITLILVSFINPYGPAIITHSLNYLHLDYLVDTTIEYQSPDFHNAVTWPFLGLLVLTIILGWFSTRRMSWTSLILICFWTVSALYSARNIPLYGQVVVVFLACKADIMVKKLDTRFAGFLSRTDLVGRRSWGWMWALLIVILMVAIQAGGYKLDLYDEGNRFDPAIFPVEAVNNLQTNLPAGNMYNDFGWGGYLLYRLWPEKRVFIDGQTDFYGEAFTLKFNQIRDAQEDWQKNLDDFRVDWVILPSSHILGKMLDQSPDWDVIYRDSTASVWVRR